jgi:hypothetical protein
MEKQEKVFPIFAKGWRIWATPNGGTLETPELELNQLWATLATNSTISKHGLTDALTCVVLPPSVVLYPEVDDTGRAVDPMLKRVRVERIRKFNIPIGHLCRDGGLRRTPASEQYGIPGQIDI